MEKVLNLYAGIGGNRKLWEDVDVTAIEINKEIAKIYQDNFPDDNVVICDAHQYLLDHFEEFDFIWSSPPCQSHSVVRIYSAVKSGQNEPLFPDMKLYEEIIFLKYYFKGKWVVENVKSYYKPLIRPQEIGRHYFWANFVIPKLKLQKSSSHDGKIIDMEKHKGLSLEGTKISHRKDQILRNCVLPELGSHILNSAFKDKQKTLVEEMIP